MFFLKIDNLEYQNKSEMQKNLKPLELILLSQQMIFAIVAEML
jgi:hypothetical protein